MLFGDYIRNGRNEMKLKKTELAKYTGITSQYVFYIEDNKIIPSEDVIKRLVSILDLNEKVAFKLADKLPLDLIDKVKMEYYDGVEI